MSDLGRFSDPVIGVVRRNGQIVSLPPGLERDRALEIELAWQAFWNGDRSGLVRLGLLPAQ